MRKKKNKIRVALSGFSGLDNPEPGNAVARTLRYDFGNSIEIEGLTYDVWSSGAWPSGLIDRLHLMPPLSSGDQTTLNRILEIHAKRPIDAIIPCLDLEVETYSRLSRQLERNGIKTLLPNQEDLDSVKKISLPYFCYQNDILTPNTIHVPNVSNVPFYADQIGYPLIVKGTIADSKKVHSRENTIYEASRLNAKWGGGVLLQPYIEGDEYVVAVVCRQDNSILGMTPVRKLGINERGKGVVGSVIEDPQLEKHARAIIKKLHWRGPLELEFISQQQEAGRFYLIEINCRFPNWIVVSEFAGCNLPGLLLREILEPRRRRIPKPRPGTAYVRDTYEFSLPADLIDKFGRFGEISAPLSNNHKKIKSSKNGYKIAITGISSFDVVMPGLGVARALRNEVEIEKLYGLGYGPYDSGAHNPSLFDSIYRLPDTDNEADLTKCIKQIKENLGLDVILPCLDHEIEKFIRIEENLKEIGVKMLLPPLKTYENRSKKHLHNMKQKNWTAFRIPESVIVDTDRQLSRSLKTLGFPLVLKGINGGSEKVYNYQHAHAVWLEMKNNGHEEILVQKFIAGDEFTVAGVCDHNSNLLQAVGVKKLVQCEKGNTWGAIKVSLPGLTENLAPYLSKLQWKGPFELEFIRDITKETMNLIEINPRFPAWIGFTSDLGVNLPLTTILSLFGIETLPKERKEDLIFLRTCHEYKVEAERFALYASRGILHHEQS